MATPTAGTPGKTNKNAAGGKGKAGAAGDTTKTKGGAKALLAKLKKAEKALDRPVYGGVKTPGQLFYATSGPVGRDSEGYSAMKAAAFCLGLVDPEYAKEEIEVSRRLKAVYQTHGFVGQYAGKGFLLPTGTNYMPRHIPEVNAIACEIKQKMAASVGGYDPDEARWLGKRFGGRVEESVKAMGTVSDTAGGVMIGFPALGEVIDLQRNREVFPSCGATEITLPPNGRMSYPKLTGGATANWVGESNQIGSSQPTTGSLDLVAKKLAVFVPLNNEFIRFSITNPSGEAVVRTDMARVSALKADLSMLEGTGGTQVKGLITYQGDAVTANNITVWVSAGAATDGDTFQPEDVAQMDGQLPDAVDDGTAWIVRKNWMPYLQNRRADAVTAADGKGPFVFNITRGGQDGRWPELYGTKVVRSRQVSNTRAKGSGTALTYAILGYFPDWIIARAGVMELLANPWGDTAFQNDQTNLRGIQFMDAGPRHAASFVMCDTLVFG